MVDHVVIRVGLVSARPHAAVAPSSRWSREFVVVVAVEDGRAIVDAGFHAAAASKHCRLRSLRFSEVAKLIEFVQLCTSEYVRMSMYIYVHLCLKLPVRNGVKLSARNDMSKLPALNDVTYSVWNDFCLPVPKDEHIPS